MKQRKVLAIASGGGHWKQLMLLRDALDSGLAQYVTTIEGLPQQENITDFKIVKDSNKNEKLALIVTLWQMFLIVLAFRPDIVISTGAAPGLLGIIWGRLFGAKTLWIDSIANGEELSMAGRIAKKVAHRVLSQWEHLAEDGVGYEGAVF